MPQTSSRRPTNSGPSAANPGYRLFRLPSGTNTIGKPRVARRSRLRGGAAFLFSAKLFANHKLEPRPDFRDGADLDVHKPQGKRQLANGVFRDGGGNLRGLLGPRNP